jgi:hypothetical protein
MAASMKKTALCDTAPCSLAEVDWRLKVMKEAVCTSEMMVYFNETTQRYILEDCYLCYF